MEGLPRLILSNWQTRELIRCQHEIDSCLCLVLKAKKNPSLIYEKQLADGMTKAWKSAAKNSLTDPLKKLLSQKPTQSRINTFLKSLDVSLSTPLTKKQIEAIGKSLTAIWKVSKREAAKDIGIKFTFDRPDKIAISALQRHQVFWVGDFYTQHLGSRIAAVTSEVLIERGWPLSEAGEALESALHSEFELIPGGRSMFAQAIPSRYAGNTSLYFKQVAATAGHTSRTFSKVQAFNEAGIVRYELINPNDERTGQICQQMSGQVFTVQQATRQMQRQLAADTPSKIKAASPWLSADTLETAIDGAAKGSQLASDNLAAAGASVLPPFHPLCRTEAVVLE